ncbi:MAG: hypothetical protein Q7U54_19570 [Bacteroidales bacterium]|nr:hypothetical protein [Bacteroidales bacterium]
MKITLIAIVICAFITANSYAQEFKESVQPLSDKAQKGQMYEVNKDDKGNSNITYRMKLDKKSEVVSYEQYSFDKNLKFINASDIQVNKENKPDMERTYYRAYVGGAGVAAMRVTLKLNKDVALETWNQKKQRYQVKKWLSSETIKAKNDDGRVYIGYASYSSNDVNKSNVFVIAKTETKDKALADKFSILLFDDKLELKDNPVDLKGAYTLVFSSMLESEDVVMVFAPKESSDLSKYVYFKYDIEGNLKNKVEFTSPASALLISAAYEQGENVYFFGTSIKSKEAFSEVFSEYAPIYNPGARAASMEGNNKWDMKWRKCLDDDMDYFHLLKFSGSQIAFASTTPVAEFKAKFKTAPGDKGASVYKGKKFQLQKFYVTSSGDYLVTGQLSGWMTQKNGNSIDIIDSYKDIVCFQIDKNGNIKAQYGIGKVNDDKASEIFSMEQNFYASADNNTIYWELWEVMGDKDWFTGNITRVFFPRIVKIDLGNSTLSAIQSMGGGKYYLRESKYDEQEKSILYIGNDLKGKNIWVGKALLN